MLAGVLLGRFFDCFSWAWLGMLFVYSVLPTPGLGNRATHGLHRTRFPSGRLGFRCILTSSAIIFLSSIFMLRFHFPCIFLAPPRRG